MEAVEIARKLIVQFDNISVFKVTFRCADGSIYETVTSVIAPPVPMTRDELEMANSDR